MIPVLTPAEMREVDRITIEEIGILGRVLMEHAGRAVARRLETLLPDGGTVGVVCGKGNNGGDGYVAARFLAHAGYDVCIYRTVEPGDLTGDALASYAVAERLGLRIEPIVSGEPLSRHDWLIDCVLGTGIRGAVRGFAAEVIRWMNESGVPILACDLPSGLDAETGRAEGACIRAAETVTIGFPKRGLLLYPGADYVGRLEVADIGFPKQAVERVAPRVFLVEETDVRERIPPRPRNAHKGDFGRVLMLCGSRGMTGAAMLAGMAALRVGAGLVTVGIPHSVNDILEVKMTEAMTLPLPETERGSLDRAAEEIVREAAARIDALAIGPGLSTHPATVALLHALLSNGEGLPGRVVLDADGLNGIAPLAEAGVSLPPGAILTPHPGEMGRLVGVGAQDIESDRIGHATRFASEHGVVLVLKGVPTVVASPDGRAFLNPTGNPAMAKGGSGDVLTGVLSGLLAQGLEPVDAAILGVYLHGLAGDLAGSRLGRGMLASELLDALPDAFHAINENGEES